MKSLSALDSKANCWGGTKSSVRIPPETKSFNFWRLLFILRFGLRKPVKNSLRVLKFGLLAAVASGAFGGSPSCSRSRAILNGPASLLAQELILGQIHRCPEIRPTWTRPIRGSLCSPFDDLERLATWGKALACSGTLGSSLRHLHSFV